MDNTGQGLAEGGALKGKADRDGIGVALDEALRDEQEFRISAIDVLQILAQVFAPHVAGAAGSAGSGIRHHNLVSNGKGGHALTHCRYAARHFMAEQSRHLKHAGMTAAPVNLYVGAAGGGGFNAEKNFTRPRQANGNFADFDLFRPQQHGAAHCFLNFHYASEPARDGVNRTFRA